MKRLLLPALTLSILAFTGCNDDDSICDTQMWYRDSDGDLLGDPENFINACEQPDGYVDNANDEDDTDFCEASTWYEDKDGDGLGNPDVSSLACTQPDGFVANADDPIDDVSVNFSYLATIDIGGETAAEISAYDPTTQKLFVTNSEKKGITVVDLSNPSNPVELTAEFLALGNINSVAVKDGKLAVAVENDNKQANGKVVVYTTSDLNTPTEYTVGALPDMVTFTPDGNYLLVANEGEPNDDYTVDPEGSVSVIELANGMVKTAGFTAFNNQLTTLRAGGYRVFGPGATLAQDTEPEYIAVSDDSATAWITLQENNGIAKLDIATATITQIYPLGFKNFASSMNMLDASNRDDVTELKNWPVLGIYMPDAISYFKTNGTGYLITANEGDARDYDGYSEEERVKDIDLDPTAFADFDIDWLQENENLGRLKITTANGDTDGDGDFDALHSYGARSFSIWSTSGTLVYDSGDEIARKNLEFAPHYFNLDNEDDATNLQDGEKDGRSDDKGAEPESTAILDMGGERQIAIIGLERVSALMVYDVTNPSAPVFLQWLQRDTDVAPEGLMTISRTESPNGKDLIIASHEASGTVSIYQNN
ncbi:MULTISPECIES: choice-of-anchor I family protein [unclassified Leeuwenhoekiella]|uniref:choice-of-anchor I family protein n=1 Tax=unclassified Leeuwenhoekiella TaxID=2615029 RepID=UPI000C4E998A|nr:MULTISPECIES: choice-of-anchor I family protein [unclassified Leeuwenhoekiella]MBA80292.1 alkaline phosphatase [Leeuwenhoekiella sp.]|tara:strand:+ start:309 stop:2096 length:1788 start_codon:yes stop_codon:yes gene_type:complete